MLVTELGIVTDVKPLQLRNAYAGILVTLSPMFNVANDVQPLNTELLESPIVVQFVALKLMVVNPLQL